MDQPDVKGARRFTSVVRRGLAQILDMELEACIEKQIQRRTGPGLSRADKLTARQVDELRGALDWIKQEAVPPSVQVQRSAGLDAVVGAVAAQINL